MLTSPACRGPIELGPEPGPPPVQMALGGPVEVRDIALEAGFQDFEGGILKRGRSCFAADFDNDGRTDVFIGNPGDPSHLLLNRSPEPGTVRFRQGPLLSQSGLYWGGAVGDLDNDGDVDLFLSGGGNEGPFFDEILANQLVERGELFFLSAGALAGVRGPELDGRVVPHASANARMLDVDADGWLDIFVNSYLRSFRNGPWKGRNLLWRNRQGRGFDEVSVQTGLTTEWSTMNSVWFDPDDDGDFELFESNFRGPNALWRNFLVDEGALRFTNITSDPSLAGGRMREPVRAFASATADFNRDGFDDLLVFVRPVEPEGSAFLDGHALFLNLGGQGFAEVARFTGLNQPFVNWRRDHAVDGVMGGQVGDLNVDGIPDVWIGQGRPADGTRNLLFLSTGELQRITTEDGLPLVVPKFENASDLIDVPAPEDPDNGITYPPYPYRTHGTCIVDFDQDGVPELAVTNGGPAAWPDQVREPNRLFSFTYPQPRRWVRIELEGDGVRVNRSAIGARVTLTVERSRDGAEWLHRQWLHGGNGFSATSDLALFFGLGDATTVSSAKVRWPDGTVEEWGPLAMDRRHRFVYAEASDGVEVD